MNIHLCLALMLIVAGAALVTASLIEDHAVTLPASLQSLIGADRVAGPDGQQSPRTAIAGQSGET